MILILREQQGEIYEMLRVAEGKLCRQLEELGLGRYRYEGKTFSLSDRLSIT